jgi:hypothetical protein
VARKEVQLASMAAEKEDKKYMPLAEVKEGPESIEDDDNRV